MLFGDWPYNMPLDIWIGNMRVLHTCAGSNNTAELTAIGEALLYVVTHSDVLYVSRNEDSGDNQGKAGAPSGNNADSAHCMGVEIHYDSEYAAKSVTGEYNGKKNVELIQRVRQHYADLGNLLSSRFGVGNSSPRISFHYVKGHSGDTWNDRADTLANLGSAGKVMREEAAGSVTARLVLKNEDDAMCHSTLVKQRVVSSLQSISMGNKSSLSEVDTDVVYLEPTRGLVSSDNFKCDERQSFQQMTSPRTVQASHPSVSSVIITPHVYGQSRIGPFRLVLYTDGACKGNCKDYKTFF